MEAILQSFRPGNSISRVIAGHVIAVAMVLSLLSPHVAGASDQWPMYQGNASHTGFIPVSLDPTKFALRWAVNLGSLALYPVSAAGGRVFVSGWGNANFKGPNFFALDSSSGVTIWSTVFRDAYANDPPSYSDGKVYIQTHDNYVGSSFLGSLLRAYDAATGSPLFKSSLVSQGLRFYAPTIYGGKIYIANGMYGGIYSFDASSGSEDWFHKLPQYGQWTPAVDENFAYAYLGSDAALYTAGLYVLDRLTGQLVYEIPDPNFSSYTWEMNLAPVLGGLSDLFAIQNGRLIKFDLNARNISWEKSANFSGQPTVFNGTVYAISSGSLGAYDESTGALEWTWSAPGGEVLQDSILGTNSHIFVRSAANTYCVDLTTRQEVWSYPAAGHLSLAESTLYIAGSDGTLTAIGLGQPDIYVSQTVVFSNADLGRTTVQTITINNVGDAPLEVQNIQSTSEEFVAQSPVLPFTIGPHESMDIDVYLTPAAGGTERGNLLITSNDPDEPLATVTLGAQCTITASVIGEGQITPSGPISLLKGDSVSFTISPNPNYQLTALFVDGVNAATSSTDPVTYTFENVTSDHAITAVFTRYFNYFGMQAGNHEEARLRYAGGGAQTQTDDISLDTTSFAPQPSYVDLQATPRTILGKTWYQAYSNGLFMKQMQSSGYTFTFDPPLLMAPTTMEAGANWTQGSTISVAGLSGSAEISGIVSPQVVVKVPAGRFLAWPIAYTLTVSGPGGTSTTRMTEWFAPCFGTIKSKDSYTTTKLTKFAIGGGTITSVPPVITKTYPKSAAHGSAIMVKGYQFGASQGTSEVLIGGVQCAVLSWSDTRIQCIVPDAAVSGQVTVVTDTWISNDTVQLKILPQITGVTPSSGKRGAPVQITGTAFGTVSGKVKFGSFLAAVTQWDDTSIICTVPAAVTLGRHPVTVKNSQGRSVVRGAFTVTR